MDKDTLKDKELLAAVTKHIKDPTFAYHLNNLVADHDRLLEKRARTETFISRLVAAADSDKHFRLYAQRLQDLQQHTSLVYSKKQWVPAEYETLENHGLVHCSYGFKDQEGLSTRTLELTEVGRKACLALQSSIKSQLSSSEPAEVG